MAHKQEAFSLRQGLAIDVLGGLAVRQLESGLPLDSFVITFVITTPTNHIHETARARLLVSDGGVGDCW
jgi:hypothetical protein